MQTVINFPEQRKERKIYIFKDYLKLWTLPDLSKILQKTDISSQTCITLNAI